MSGEPVLLVREDAESLLRMLPAIGDQQLGRPAQPFRGMMLGKTTSAGLNTNVAGDVRVHTPNPSGWAESSPLETIKAWAWPTPIVGETNVLVFEVNGRYVAMEVC
jgi:hypothetical protein